MCAVPIQRRHAPPAMNPSATHYSRHEYVYARYTNVPKVPETRSDDIALTPATYETTAATEECRRPSTTTILARIGPLMAFQSHGTIRTPRRPQDTQASELLVPTHPSRHPAGRRILFKTPLFAKQPYRRSGTRFPTPPVISSITHHARPYRRCSLTPHWNRFVASPTICRTTKVEHRPLSPPILWYAIMCSTEHPPSVRATFAAQVI